MLWGGVCRVKENKGEKKWDNCNSIINKTFLKNHRNSNIILRNKQPMIEFNNNHVFFKNHAFFMEIKFWRNTGICRNILDMRIWKLM